MTSQETKVNHDVRGFSNARIRHGNLEDLMVLLAFAKEWNGYVCGYGRRRRAGSEGRLFCNHVIPLYRHFGTMYHNFATTLNSRTLATTNMNINFEQQSASLIELNLPKGQNNVHIRKTPLLAL
jgi:hypothetical protein